jgi:AraC-like DNA-binding protein
MKETLGIPLEYDGFAALHTVPIPRSRYNPRFHTHTELEVNLFLRGTARYLTGNRLLEMSENTLIWFFPEQEHAMVEQSPGCQAWVLVFRPEMIRRVCKAHASKILQELNPPGTFCRQLQKQTGQRLNELFREVSNCAADTDRCNAGLAYALLASWSAYLTAAETLEGASVHPAIQKAAELVSCETGAQNMGELSRKAGLSPKRLGRLFKQQVGLPLSTYRNQVRIQRFLSLYGQGFRINMLEAALEAGFGSYAQFHRAFKHAMGCSPAEFHRRIR